jgi:hypothetical protein
VRTGSKKDILEFLACMLGQGQGVPAAESWAWEGGACQGNGGFCLEDVRHLYSVLSLPQHPHKADTNSSHAVVERS